MSVFKKFENGVENVFETAAGAVFKAPIEPAQIAKRAERQMKANKLVGAGHQYAPTLYNVLVNRADDKRLFGFYPTMAAEIETYLMSRGADGGLEFDGRPLVRFIVDDKLKSGRFDVIAETVSAPVIRQLREEEMFYNGIAEVRTPEPYREPYNEPYDEPYDDERPIERKPSGVARPYANLPSPSAPPANAPLAQGTQPDLPAHNQPALGKAFLHNQNNGRDYPLNTRAMTCGRDRSCDIALDDANASRCHARFEQNAAGTWKVVDMGSTNGTQINGTTSAKTILRNGDVVTVGMTILEFWER